MRRPRVGGDVLRAAGGSQPAVSLSQDSRAAGPPPTPLCTRALAPRAPEPWLPCYPATLPTTTAPSSSHGCYSHPPAVLPYQPTHLLLTAIQPSTYLSVSNHWNPGLELHDLWNPGLGPTYQSTSKQPDDPLQARSRFQAFPVTTVNPLLPGSRSRQPSPPTTTQQSTASLPGPASQPSRSPRSLESPKTVRPLLTVQPLLTTQPAH